MIHKSCPLDCYCGKSKCRLWRYKVTNEPAVSLSDIACGSDQRKRQTYYSSMVVCHGMGWWVLPKMGKKMRIFGCPGVLIVLDLMMADEVTFLSFFHPLSRECSFLRSAPLAGALVSCRAQRAMGARCPCSGTALRTPSKPSSVLPAMRTGSSAAGPVQAENGIATGYNEFYGTAPVCNTIFFFFLVNPFI